MVPVIGIPHHPARCARRLDRLDLGPDFRISVRHQIEVIEILEPGPDPQHVAIDFLAGLAHADLDRFVREVVGVTIHRQ